jgi:CHASE3 domain sensor protein
MTLAPEIIIEIDEIEKDINAKVEEMNNYIIKKEKQNENILEVLVKENKELKALIINKLHELIKENKELKAKINFLENVLNVNFGG